jgi:hypothetical protein
MVQKHRLLLFALLDLNCAAFCISEAFAAFLPAGGVPLSYAIAISYVLVDTFDKGRKAKVESMSEFTRKASALPPTLNPDK